MILRRRAPVRGAAHDPASATPRAPLEGPGDRWALWFLLLVHVALEAALVVAAWTFFKSLRSLPLTASQKAMFEIGFAGAFLVFGGRAYLLYRRLRRGARSPRS